jgi:hypothetical protein
MIYNTIYIQHINNHIFVAESDVTKANHFWLLLLFNFVVVQLLFKRAKKPSPREINLNIITGFVTLKSPNYVRL